MTRIFHIKDLLSRPLPVDTCLALDTNILIQVADATHAYHRLTLTTIRDIRERTKVRFVYFLASKLEFQEYMRRKLFTERFRAFANDPAAGEVMGHAVQAMRSALGTLSSRP